MTRQQLVQHIISKKSFLCVGLDPDLNRLPRHLLKMEDPIFEFNKQIIDATKDLCVAYKPNIAFYEALGIKGWQSLQKTLDYIPKEHFTIADAKRGDIGNTSSLYAKTFFETMDFDAVTVAPYMGEDSVKPFLAFENKWTILLALTSNKGSLDFQFINDQNDTSLHENVLLKAQEWSTPDQLMFVVGATHPENFQHIRQLAPHSFILVPGIGAQGGDLAAVIKYGSNAEIGLLVSASRGIIYASNKEDFALKARESAKNIQQQMVEAVEKRGLLTNN